VAELVAGGNTRFVLKSDGALVGRRSRDGSFVPDVDLADLEGGLTVSRRHVRVYPDGSTWRLQVEPKITNQTVVAGRTLDDGEPVELSDGDEIQLGKVMLVFRVGSAAPPPNPEATLVRVAEAPAILRSDDQDFPLSAPPGRVLTLGRHTADRSYRPDVDLGDRPSGRTVSRQHAQLFTQDGHWMMRVEEPTNDTLQNGTKLAYKQIVVLTDGDQLQFGRVVATFHLAEQITAVDEKLIELILDPPQLTVEAGAETQVAVTIINHTDHVDYFDLQLEGIPRDWYRILLPNGQVGDPARVQLFSSPLHAKPSADAMKQLRIVIAPPRSCQSRAGVHPLAISATTVGQPRMRRVVPSQLTVGRFEGLRFELEPKQIRGGRGTYVATLQNLGNDVATAVLSSEGTDLIEQWDRPQVLQGLGLSSCAKDQVGLNVRVKRRHWLGPDRTYHLKASVVAGTVQVSQAADLVCPPRIPWWLQTLQQRIWQVMAPIWTIVLPIIVLVGVYLLFLQPPQIKKFDTDPSDLKASVVNQPIKLSWELSKPAPVSVANANNPSDLHTLDPNQTDLSITPSQTGQISYTLIACNQYLHFGPFCNSAPLKDPITVTPVLPPAVIQSFEAQPKNIGKEGDPVQLDWTVQAPNVPTPIAVAITSSNAKEQLDKPTSDPTGAGLLTVHPSETVTYTLSVKGADGKTATKATNVTIDPPSVDAVAHSQSPDYIVGAPIHLNWSAKGFTQLTLGASVGTAKQPIDVVAGKQTVDLTQLSPPFDAIPTQAGDVTYVITATNASGSVAKADANPVTVKAFTIVDFSVDQPQITPGQTVKLSWNAPGATKIQIDPVLVSVPQQPMSSTTDTPKATTDYVLTATGPDGKTTAKKNAQVTVGLGSITIAFTPAPPTINKGDKSTLAFTVTNAKHVKITGAAGSSQQTILDRDVTPTFQGSVQVSPTDTTIYTLLATNDTSSVPMQVTVTVAPPTPTPGPGTPAAGGGTGGGGSGGGGGGGGGGPTPTPKR
jgi:predicted component of type VI protein secretion system